MTFHPATLPFALLLSVGFATAGCQSMAIAMDDPLAYDSSAPAPARLNAHCSTDARNAAVWGTLPSAWCAPYGPYWSGPGYAYYGRPYGRTWRGPGWGHQYRGFSGRGFGGGWRGGGRGGRR